MSELNMYKYDKKLRYSLSFCRLSAQFCHKFDPGLMFAWVI